MHGFVEEDVTGDLLPKSSNIDVPTYLLLYLNQYTFSQEDEDKGGLTSLLESCIKDQAINLVLVHEHDVVKGGCDFGLYFKKAPQHLINEPYNLFKEIATTLYSEPEYRRVALKLLLCKMGAISN